MRLTLQRCAIRPFRQGDEPELRRHADDRDVARNLRDRFPHPYTLNDARHWVDETLAQKPLTNFAVTVDDRVVGAIGFMVGQDIHRRSAEIGYWLGREVWGRGIATEALIAVTAHAFATHDLARLYAGVFPWNPASARVLEKAGYTLEARLRDAVTKDGKTMDELLYARVRP